MSGAANQLFDTYYQMWVNRMADGHNAESRAMHYGYSEQPEAPFSSQEAKLATNDLVLQELGIAHDTVCNLADLGCGVGGTAIHFANKLPHAKILAVNVHQPQLRLLANLVDYPLDRITPVNANFVKLPFRDNSLDGAYAIDSSCYAIDKDAFYQEALRCLAPGRRLVIFDVFDKRPPATGEERELYKQSVVGWAVPSWHPIPNIDTTGQNKFRNITDNMMPDITRSYQIALDKLDTATDPIMLGHLQAIIALYHGLQTGLIQYGLLTMTKS